jgi:hypothetical protein
VNRNNFRHFFERFVPVFGGEVLAEVHSVPYADFLFRDDCGAWYAVRPESGTNSFYPPACRASEIFGKADSRSTKRFGYGLSLTDFQQAFAVCLIGACVAPEAFIRGTVAREVTERNFVLFNVQQLGRPRTDAQ